MSPLHSILDTLSRGHPQLVIPCLCAGLAGVAAGAVAQRVWTKRQVHLRPTSEPESKDTLLQPQDARSGSELESESEGDEDSEEEGDEESSDDEGSGQRHHKMVLVVRTDLGMGKGKMAAQCCHAAVAAISTARRRTPAVLRRYTRYGAAKVALKCGSEEELLDLHSKARAAGLVAEYIEDAGRTQIPEGSRTVLAIGPAPIADVDSITGHLKLL